MDQLKYLWWAYVGHFNESKYKVNGKIAKWTKKDPLLHKTMCYYFRTVRTFIKIDLISFQHNFTSFAIQLLCVFNLMQH